MYAYQLNLPMFNFFHHLHLVTPAKLSASALMTSPHSFVLSIILLAIFAFFALIVLMLVSYWKIFQKAGKPGWASIVPFYNYVLALDIAGKPFWWILFLVMPVINIIFLIIVARRIAANFGKGRWFTVGMILLPYIFLPILAFGNAQYRQPELVTSGISEGAKWAFIGLFAFLIFETPFYISGLVGRASGSPQPLTVIDAAQQYAADNNYVYYQDVAIDGADPASFKTKDVYAVDDHHVYYQGTVLDGADPDTFITFGNDSYYAKDAAHVYSAGKVVDGAAPSSFKIIDGSSYGKDAVRLYDYGTPVTNIDPATVTIIGGQYLMDAKNVYYINSFGGSIERAIPVVGADRSTFSTAYPSNSDSVVYDAQDTNHYYYQGKVI